MDDKILKELNNTQVYSRLKQIKACYEKIEKKQVKFCESFQIHCMKDCGECCAHFMPDITEIEAEFLAYGLIKEDKADLVLELLKYREGCEDYCPLFIEDSPYHCSVYKWRPLICRLFGASATKDKNGNPTFRKCKWNEEGHDITPEEFEAQKKAILLMSDFGEMLQNIDPNANETALLPEALPRAINKLRFLIDSIERS